MELEDNALDVHEMSEAMKQAHTHEFDMYFEEFSNRYLKKKEKDEREEMAD